MTDLTPEKRAKLRELLDAATDGPWYWRNTQQVYLFGARSRVVMAFERMGMQGAQPVFRDAKGMLFPAGRENLWQIPDARLIAEAVNALPALLDAADERDRLHEDHLAFTTPLGFGDGVTEPAARLAELVYPIHDAFCDARDHLECPRICGTCGEWLADQTCEHCHGSGCGPGTASGAYEECEWCAGIGKVHPGCADASYADLRDERDRLAAQVQCVYEYGIMRPASMPDMSGRDRYTQIVGSTFPTEEQARMAARHVPALRGIPVMICRRIAPGEWEPQ